MARIIWPRFCKRSKTLALMVGRYLNKYPTYSWTEKGTYILGGWGKIQGVHKRRTLSKCLLHNLWQFVYVHQGYQIFHFNCDLKTVLFHWKNSWFLPYLAYFGQIAWQKGLLRAYLTSNSSPKGTSYATWFCKLSFFGLYKSGGV